MAVLFRNAQVFFAGYNVSGDLNQVALTHEAESLDGTTFGASTRTRKGGLRESTLTGAGLWQAGAQLVDPVLFDLVGSTDDVAHVFPDGITEGSTSTGSGYMLKMTEGNYRLGGRVGELIPFSFEARDRGVQA